jgi:endonuclease/exonuclease/phosphatase family metal-dependent hydrolase
LNRRALALVLAIGSASCRAVINYPSPSGPRYAGAPVAPPVVPASAPKVVHVVTYNVQWGKHIDRAISVLETRAPLPQADIIVLQEMDANGTRQIADALGMFWVYYPAVIHPKLGHDFGNAVLSRWPIVSDEKLMLPHIGGLRHSQRIATAATILAGSTKIRVYSVHLGTPSEIRPSKRRDQADMILADAIAYPMAIVAGDMNSHGIGKEFVAHGFSWPTQHNGFTTAVFNWDHVFLKGFTAPAADQKFTGIVRDTLGTSDHDPVWATAQLPPP